MACFISAWGIPWRASRAAVLHDFCVQSHIMSLGELKLISSVCAYPTRVVAVMPSYCGIAASGALHCRGILRK